MLETITPKLTKIKATAGSVLINEALPEKYRDYSEEGFNKQKLEKILKRIANEDPQSYQQVIQNLIDLGAKYSTLNQRVSIGIDDLKDIPEIENLKSKLRDEIEEIIKRETKDIKKRNEEIIKKIIERSKEISDKTYETLIKKENPLGIMADSKLRGNKTQLSRIISGDLIYLDQNENPIPFLIDRSYAQSLYPAQYWSATYGARKGLVDTKIGTGKVGYLSKQFAFAAHRLIVDSSGKGLPDDFNEPKNVRALPVSTDDMDSIGSILAREFGKYKRGTIITGKVLEDLRKSGIDEILIRSPITSNTPKGGVYSIDVGIRENGKLPDVGYAAGLISAQVLSEPITQLQISSKHSGGALMAKVVGNTGFKYLNQILQVPKQYSYGMIYAEDDGKILKIKDSEIGGKDVVMISNKGEEKVLYVPPDRKVTVEEGQIVEAGDAISSGTPNPAKVVKYKGIGEGRRYLMNLLVDFYRTNDQPVNRRNVELLVRGAIDHIIFTKRFKQFLPGDIIKYSDYERFHKPRQGSEIVKVENAKDSYLEQPVLHYTIGTRITDSVINTLKKFGINEIIVNKKPFPFEPIMVSLERQSLIDPDWQVKLMGGYQLRKFLEQFFEGATTELKSTSYVPALASGTITKLWPP